MVVEAGLSPFSVDEWRDKQHSDEKLRQIIAGLKEDHNSKGPIRYPHYALDEHGILTYGRPKSSQKRVVPREWCRTILKGYHDGATGGHRSAQAMLASISRKYYWPLIDLDVRTYVKECPQCEQRNAGFVGRAPLQDNYQATRPFQKKLASIS